MTWQRPPIRVGCESSLRRRGSTSPWCRSTFRRGKICLRPIWRSIRAAWFRRWCWRTAGCWMKASPSAAISKRSIRNRIFSAARHGNRPKSSSSNARWSSKAFSTSRPPSAIQPKPIPNAVQQALPRPRRASRGSPNAGFRSPGTGSTGLRGGWRGGTMSRSIASPSRTSPPSSRSISPNG